MIRRKVVSVIRLPDIRRASYVLECDHRVERAYHSGKRWAMCGHCEDRDDGLTLSK